MAYPYSSNDRWNYFRGMPSREGPQEKSMRDSMQSYQDPTDHSEQIDNNSNNVDDANGNGFFPPNAHGQRPVSSSSATNANNNPTSSEHTNTHNNVTESPISTPNPSGAPPPPLANPAPYSFNLQYSFPERRSVRSWIHELPNDGQINVNLGGGGGGVSVNGRGSSMGGSINIAPATGLDPARRPSMTSTVADTESLMSPSSSRASPRPMGPGIPLDMRYHFSSLYMPDTPSPQPTPVPHMHYQPVHHPSASNPNVRPSLDPTANSNPNLNSNRGIPLRGGGLQPTPAGGPTTSISMPTVPTTANIGASLANIPGLANAASGRPHIAPVIPPAIPPYQPRSAPPIPKYMPDLAPVVKGPGGGNGVEPLPPSEARFVAIGIDFGTTYSGVSWVFSGDPTDIKEVSQYPCLGTTYKSRDEVQVPTQYDQRSGAWGYLLDKAHSPVKWFKLLLLRDADIRDDIRNSPYLQSARQQASLLGEDGVIDLIADFLRHLWQHALREIELQIDAVHLQNLPFKVALTIPAIWPQYARNMMKSAVRRAGILQRRDIADTTLILVEEPEAAALATLLDRREYPEMGVGETFMVVDCGGGTIDIISYKIVQTSPFVIHEAVKGDGKLCGAFLVDDKFENYMRHLSGLRFENCEPADFRKFVYDEWETAIKRSFTNSELQPEFYLHPPIKALSKMNRFKGNNKHVLRRSTIVGFFDETYQGIRQLINDQNKKIVAQEGKPPKKIILVGGLGSSRYLFQRLQTEYSNVMQPQRPWSAVARGAVIKLLKNTFKREDVVAAADDRQLEHLNGLPEMDVRIARYSYGVETGIPLQKALSPIIPGIDRITVEPDGQQRVWRMQWYVKQGEVMDNREPVSYKFYEYVTSPASKQTKFLIYTSDQMPPPERRDAGCQLLCTLFCDYDTPYHELPVVDESSGLRLVDNMHLTMRFEGEPEWRLQVGSKSIDRKVDEGRVDVQFA
ncbi:hypothetical protein SBRCBS47491_004798 [Sporothrix bragantina]|uniref:Hsp70 family chaperone n=1 Tax=Sporothrix bragantina TaxID=671064 RepID=A0ABP0BSV1_9PEZI